MNRKLPLLSALFVTLLLVQPSVHALALAELQLNSSLNQPLNATIDLISATPADLDSLRTTISRSEFQEGNVQKWPKVNVELVRVENGRSYLKLTSENAVREPVLGFLLELDWAEGRIKREYSLLIDPQ